MSTTLAEVVAKTRNLFLDFDGPICSIFAGYPAPTVANDLREALAALGSGVTSNPALEATDDPLQVLRIVGESGDEDTTRRVADALREAEVTAAASAEPTPHANEAIYAALSTGRRLTVVSNNSREAVTAYLEKSGLLTSFVRVVGRYDGMSPTFMKPSNHLIGLALIGTDAPPWSSTFVGDSVTDIQAARSVPIASIGYGAKPGRSQALADAGADVVITTMAELAEALAEPLA